MAGKRITLKRKIKAAANNVEWAMTHIMAVAEEFADSEHDDHTVQMVQLLELLDAIKTAIEALDRSI